jgi:hypothetical protein
MSAEVLAPPRPGLPEWVVATKSGSPEWVVATKFGQLHGAKANQLWRLTHAGALTAVSNSDRQPAG